MSSNLLLIWENWTPKAELFIMSEELLEKMKSKLQDIFKVLEEYSYGSNCRVSAVYGHISDSIPNSLLGLLAPLYLQFHMIFF